MKAVKRSSPIRAVLEIAILFAVLFMPGIALPHHAAAAAAMPPFDTRAVLARAFLSDLPAAALVFFFLIGRSPWSARGIPRPGRRDAAVAGVGFVALLALAAGAFALESFLPGFAANARLSPPRGAPAIAAALAACAVTGYLEEGFFRAYLITRLGDLGLGTARSVAASTVLFALCHLYEGPWGVVNAALAGTLLSVAFLRYRSVHGPAWAHGAYNFFIYLGFF